MCGALTGHPARPEKESTEHAPWVQKRRSQTFFKLCAQTATFIEMYKAIFESGIQLF